MGSESGFNCIRWRCSSGLDETSHLQWYICGLQRRSLFWTHQDVHLEQRTSLGLLVLHQARWHSCAARSRLPIVLYHDWSTFANASFSSSDFEVPSVCKTTSVSCTIPGDTSSIVV